MFDVFEEGPALLPSTQAVCAFYDYVCLCVRVCVRVRVCVCFFETYDCALAGFIVRYCLPLGNRQNE